MVLVYIRYINALETILTILTNSRSSTYFINIVEHLKYTCTVDALLLSLDDMTKKIFSNKKDIYPWP